MKKILFLLITLFLLSCHDDKIKKILPDKHLNNMEKPIKVMYIYKTCGSVHKITLIDANRSVKTLTKDLYDLDMFFPYSKNDIIIE